jgi:hypothetical protein
VTIIDGVVALGMGRPAASPREASPHVPVNREVVEEQHPRQRVGEHANDGGLVGLGDLEAVEAVRLRRWSGSNGYKEGMQRICDWYAAGI